MRSTIQLEIAEPCHENWQQMTPSQQGRFCGSCQKTVVDFSNMSDKQLLAYFKNYNGGVCGRFDDRQLLRPLVTPPALKPGWIKWAIASLITFLSFSSKAKAQGNVLLYGKVAKKNPQEIVCTTKRGEVTAFEAKLNQLEIKGTVKDEHGLAIPYASVTVAGSKWGTAADSLGNYVLQIPMQQTEYTIAASAVGYQPMFQNLNISDNNKNSFDFTLALDTTLADVIVQGYSSIKGRVLMGAVGTTVRVKKEIPNTFIGNEKTSGNIYPNPAKPGSNVTISFNKAGTFGWRLVNTSGMEILKQESRPVIKNQSQTVILPANLSAGQYYIQVLDAGKKPLQTFKLMVMR